MLGWIDEGRRKEQERENLLNVCVCRVLGELREAIITSAADHLPTTFNL